MRFANLAGRLTLVLDDGRGADVERLSAGEFGADPQAAFDRWGALLEWGAGLDLAHVDGAALDPARLGPPVPRPRQVFAIGLNYREHARETGADIPDRPVVFTKFASCLTGPVTGGGRGRTVDRLGGRARRRHGPRGEQRGRGPAPGTTWPA